MTKKKDPDKIALFVLKCNNRALDMRVLGKKRKDEEFIKAADTITELTTSFMVAVETINQIGNLMELSQAKKDEIINIILKGV